MRSALLVCDRGALVKHLRERFAINWHGDHGAAHWARVRNNGHAIPPKRTNQRKARVKPHGNHRCRPRPRRSAFSIGIIGRKRPLGKASAPLSRYKTG